MWARTWLARRLLRVAHVLAWRDQSVRMSAYILVTAAQMLDLGRKNHFDC